MRYMITSMLPANPDTTGPTDCPCDDDVDCCDDDVDCAGSGYGCFLGSCTFHYSRAAAGWR
eukprot:COSAG06_NODE_18910_length_862_cov_1.469201_1_plen_60_part_10